jgi:para-nitrobenzyl esterase
MKVRLTVAERGSTNAIARASEDMVAAEARVRTSDRKGTSIMSSQEQSSLPRRAPTLRDRGALRWSIATALLGAVVGTSVAGCDDFTSVKVEGGRLQGTSAEGIAAFKGIPYAAPPVGELRWRPPAPVAPWKGVLRGSDYAADCWQLPSEMPLEGPSEDCLYLNVWRPAMQTEKPLPVMVWLHGGGLVRGAASWYPGQYLAQHEIVVVTFNYRIGRLGFFAHPALARATSGEPRGNYGYLDQIAALQWVQRNIRAFGGDPTNVTIAGQSAGGGSVLVHLTSPMSRGLFHRAIVQSAVAPSARAGATPLVDLRTAERMAMGYAASLDIEGDDEGAASALRELSAEKLTEGADLASVVTWSYGGTPVSGFAGAILDGDVVTETPEASLRSGKMSVPVLTGANDADLAASAAKSKEEVFAELRKLEPHARTLYDPSGALSVPELAQAVMSDRATVEPSRNLAELATEWGFPAYYYRFSYVPEWQREEVKGARHGAEIAYAFDAVTAVSQGRETAADTAMATTMSSCWAAFVRTGNPNGGGCPEWLPYETQSRTVMTFNNKEAAYGPDPLKARLDLWRFYWR